MFPVATAVLDQFASVDGPEKDVGEGEEGKKGESGKEGVDNSCYIDDDNKGYVNDDLEMNSFELNG